MMKIYKQAPLPFRGQKRNYLNNFSAHLNRIIPDNGEGWTIIDLFGGSGLLAHWAKRLKPSAEVIFNDFEDYHQNIALIPLLNGFLKEVRSLNLGKKNDKISASNKAKILEIIEKYDFKDMPLLNRYFIFSSKNCQNWDNFINSNWYNNFPKERIPLASDYLQDIEIIKEDFKNVLKNKINPQDKKTFLILDPPYIRTDQSYYTSTFNMLDLLVLLEFLENFKGSWLYFDSSKNEVLEVLKYKKEQGKIKDFQHEILKQRAISFACFNREILISSLR